MNETNLNLRQFIPPEFCLKCYGCCRFKEKESVWAPFAILPIHYQDYFICPNLDLKTNHCKIYSKRPFDCRLYPFLLNSAEGGSASGRRKKDKVFLSVHLSCPFIRENLEKGSFKGYVKYLKKFLSKIKKELKSFSAEYPQDEILELYEINRIRR